MGRDFCWCRHLCRLTLRLRPRECGPWTPRGWGVAVGIWSAIALILALAIAGFVSGVLAIRAGFLHGIATWATSLVAMLVLIGWLGASVVGALGGAIGNIAQGAMENTQITEDLGAAAEDAEVDQQ